MNQKGSALVYVLMTIAVSSTIIAGITLHFHNQQVANLVFERQMSRDMIARNIASGLTNPLVLLESVDPSVNLPGNNLLRTCLGSPTPKTGLANALATLNNSTSSGTACNTNGIDPKVGMEFLLIPEKSYLFGPANGSSNCPPSGQAIGSKGWDTQSMSCFLAGKRNNNEYVAYSFDGDTNASPSIKFPLIAKVFFYPICRKDNPSQTACAFAEAIMVRYEIIQSVQTGLGVQLGTYPHSPEWINVDTISISGLQCNPGAIATANENTGMIECQCYRPFIQITSNGVPVINAQGPVCKNELAMCPPGFVLTGHDAKSNPICNQMINLVSASKGPSYLTTDPPVPHRCNINNNGGWISNIEKVCSANYQLNYYECPQGCGGGDVLAAVMAGTLTFGLFIAMTIIGIVLFAAYLAASGSLFGAIELQSVLAAIAIWVINFGQMMIVAGLGMSMLAAFLPYAMGQNWDWVYVTEQNNQTPMISCQVYLECGQVSPTPTPNAASDTNLPMGP